MLYVDGMNGVISHNETIQWLYSLTASKVCTYLYHTYHQLQALGSMFSHVGASLFLFSHFSRRKPLGCQF